MFYKTILGASVRIKTDMLAGAIMLFLLAVAAGGADPNALEDTANTAVAQADATGEELAAIGESAVPGEDVMVDKTIQSITFKKGMAITDALTFLQHRYRKNIIWTPGVEGAITVSTLYDVTFEQAMEAILGYGFKYVKEDNFIKVYTDDEYKTIREDSSRMIYRVFQLNYISAAEVKNLVAPVLSDKGKIESTSPALTGVPTDESITADAGGGDTTASEDIVVICDYPENMAKAEEVISAVDVRPRQVLIEATIMSVTLTDAMELGVDWQTLKGTAVDAIGDLTPGSPSYFGFIDAGVSVDGVANTTGGITIGFVQDDMAALITAVEEITNITILANPKILAVNKQLGQVYIGTKIAYVSEVTVTETGTTMSVEFLDTGTKLSFRPYIGDDGYITRDTQTKDSYVSVRKINVETGQEAPDETSAELVSNIIVKDGETIVIGGMFRDTTTSRRAQVPLLGEIPVLGALFRSTADEVVREEVIILLTPHIIDRPSELNGDARAKEVGQKRLGARNQLPLIMRARLADGSYSKAVKLYSCGRRDLALRELNWTLHLQPDYYEALRLRERIIGECAPGEVCWIERVMLHVIEVQEAPNWQRR